MHASLILYSFVLRGSAILCATDAEKCAALAGGTAAACQTVDLAWLPALDELQAADVIGLGGVAEGFDGSLFGESGGRRGDFQPGDAAVFGRQYFDRLRAFDFAEGGLDVVGAGAAHDAGHFALIKVGRGFGGVAVSKGDEAKEEGADVFHGVWMW